MSKQFTFYIKPDANCTNIHIEWIGTPGLLVNCKNNTEITVAIDPEATGEHCIEGIATCVDANGNQSCSTCEPVHFRKCFCSTDADCGECGECGSDGLCTDTCTEEELAKGKKCLSDGCGCPPTKPKYDPVLGCVECLKGEAHPTNPCLVCVDGSWVVKNCDDGICDETNGGCIPDCATSTDGRTVWNPTTQQCECAPGFEFDIDTMKCVEKEVPCDPGLVRNPVTGLCEPIPCPEGFEYSIEEEDCVPVDCTKIPCSNGLECPDGCGCDGTKCVDCTTNPTALGCGDGCGKEYCDEDNPCVGEDCTCVDNECVGCNNFPCNICGTYEGCACTNSTCEGDGDNSCKDDATIDLDGCTVKTELTKNTPCTCNAIGASAKFISLVESGTLNSEEYRIVLEADLRKKFASNVAQYELINRFTDVDINNELPITGNITFAVTAYYKDLENNIVFPDTDNIVSITKDISSNAITETVVRTDSTLIATNNIVSEAEGSDQPTQIGTRLPDTVSIKFVGFTVKVTYSNLAFENNCDYGSGDIYNAPNIIHDAVPSTTESYFTVSKISAPSNTSRFPVLQLDRLGATGSLSTLNGTFRKLFVEPTSDKVYDDVLFSPKKFTNDTERGTQDLQPGNFGGLLPTLSYQATWDCTCADPVIIENLTICDIEFTQDVQFEIGNNLGNPTLCNDKLTIINDFDLCDLNKDLESFGWDAEVAAAFQTKYILSVNGTDVATFVHKDGLGLVLDSDGSTQFVGYEYNATEQITSVSLRQNHDDSCRADNTIDILIDDVIISTDCNTSTGKVNITIRETGTQVANVKANNGAEIVFTGSTYTFTGLDSKVVHTITVTYAGGCTKTYDVSKDCCSVDNLEVSIESTIGRESNEKALTINTKFNKVMQKIQLNGVDLITSTTTSYIGVVTITGSQAVIVVTTADGCEYTYTEPIVENPDSDVTIEPALICSGESSTLFISSSNPNVEVNVLAPDNSVLSGTTDANGNIDFSGLNQNGSYTITKFGTTTPNLIRNLEVSDLPQVTSFSIRDPKATYCTNDQIIFDVTGTPNSTVNISTNDGQVEDVLLGVDGLGSVTLGFIGSGAKVITLNNITNASNCTQNIGSTINITVVAASTMSISDTCVAPLSSTSDIDIQVNTSNATSVKVVLSDGTEIGLTSGAPATLFTGTISQGSGQTVTVVADNGSCETSQEYTFQSCSCDFIQSPMEPQLDFSCAGNPVNVVFSPISGLQMEWYEITGGGDVALLPNAWSKSLNIGFYKVRHYDPATMCTSAFTDFQVKDGDISTISMTFSNTDPIVGEVVTVTANITVPLGSGTAGITYNFFVDNILQQSNTSNIFLYTPADTASHNIKVLAQRGNTLCSNETDQDITATEDCTDVPIIQVANAAGYCINPVASIQNFVSGSTYQFDWKVSNSIVYTQTISTTAENTTGVTWDILADGAYAIGSITNYTLEVSKDGCPPVSFTGNYVKGFIMSIDLSTISWWGDGDFNGVYPSIIRVRDKNGSECNLFSGSPTCAGIPDRGNEEVLIYNGSGGSCTDQQLIDAIFASNPARNPNTFADAKLLIDADLAILYPGTTIELSGDVLSMASINCDIKRFGLSNVTAFDINEGDCTTVTTANVHQTAIINSTSSPN